MATPDTCDLLCLDLPRAEKIRAGLPSSTRLDGFAATAKALSDPTRVALTLALADEQELCVCDLSWIVGRSEQLVSHHLKALRGAGLVESRRDGKMVMYSLSPAGDALLAMTQQGAAR